MCAVLRERLNCLFSIFGQLFHLCEPSLKQRCDQGRREKKREKKKELPTPESMHIIANVITFPPACLVNTSHS